MTTKEAVAEEVVVEQKDVPVPIEAEDDGELPHDQKHWLQKLMDNPWLLLLLGLLVPFLSYTLWGWVELMMVPPAQLP